MSKGSVLLTLVLLLVPVSGAAQAPRTAAQFEEWHRDVHRAAELYATGDTAGALALLDKGKVPPQEHRDLAKAIFLDLELLVVDAANRRQLPRAEPKLHPVWTMHLARALAALHMEGVLDAYKRQTEEGLGDHLAIAEYLFANIARIENRPDGAPAWELAIGLIAVTEVRTIWARSFLDAACRQYPDDAALLLACGSVHEAVAMLPADILARWPVRLDRSRSELRARDTVTIVSLLDKLTDDSGGELIYVKPGSDLSAVFRTIVADFKTRYLLTYAPAGVPASGWHPITVTVKVRGATVRARRGYTR